MTCRVDWDLQAHFVLVGISVQSLFLTDSGWVEGLGSMMHGNTKSKTWLADYLIAVQIGGGNENVAMQNLSLYLEGSARAWLNNLPEDSIYSWRELEDVFFKNFKGTYKRLGGYQELMLCVQKPKESTQDYIHRWT